jgi:hypothetical protein
VNTGDPQGKRALFDRASTFPVDPDIAHGRHALFSTATPRAGTVVVDCSSCGEHKRVQIVEAVARILRMNAWLPLIRYNRWMLCPSCERRGWCRVGWLD